MLTACGSTTTQTTTTPTSSPETTASPTETPQTTTPSPTDTTQTSSTTEGIIFKEPVKNQLNGYMDALNNSSKTTQTIEAGKPIQLSGWAIAPDLSQPAESVIITYGDTNTVITTIPVSLNRPDVAKTFKKPALEKSGWVAKLDPASLNLTGNTAKIKAWSYNSQTKEAYPLNNSFEIVLK
ncbi:hypothetical protein [Chroococcus sp. FPU101]|uniref:hypothetical protein n=1 Tax=Chroococcus sp. FPU101 TaxID=1974212 RepID=UPI001A9034A6|nr:hypothetical protein [Chroococcus sp. FPU101]GFE71330.1 hypothetical protein CFPU101_39400 [Chroococcus sp. FPU101]